jgi:hypothetical protein
MSDQQFETEVHRRIYENTNGYYLTVSPSADFPGNVMLIADEIQSEYFGNLRLDLPAAMMVEIGKALIAAAYEVTQ